MTTETNTTFLVPKLNDQNYQSWKFKVKMLLIREGSWKCIDEPVQEYPEEAWVELDQKAQSTISLSVDDGQIVHICKCDTTQEMWSELQKVHERVNLSNKLYLMRKLYQSKLKEGQDMQEYIRSVLEIVGRLLRIGENIDDFRVTALLLSGLLDYYEALVTALDVQDADELTLEYVKGKLVDKYKRKMESSSKNSSKSETALKAYNNSKFKNKTKKKESNDNLKETRECFICKRKGHLKKDCRIWLARMAELKKNEKGHTAKTAREEEDGTSDNEKAFVVYKSDMSTNAWYIDSGATSHMTNNKHFFTSFDDTKEDKISLANGQHMLSTGIGDGYICCQIEEKTSRIPVKNVLFVPSLDSNLLSVKQVAKQGNTV